MAPPSHDRHVDDGFGVPADRLLDGLSRNGVPLPHEVGTFVTLQVCEALVERPAVVDLPNVLVSADGDVALAAERRGDEAAAARAVVTLLGNLLVRSAPGVPTVLLELVEHGPQAGSWELAPLRDELEASLVPLNRGALRRVLARVVREAGRARPRGEGGTLDERALTAELDAMLGSDGEEAARVRRLRQDPGPAPQAAEAAPEPSSPSEEHADGAYGAGESQAHRVTPGSAAERPAADALSARAVGAAARVDTDAAEMREVGFAGGRPVLTSGRLRLTVLLVVFVLVAGAIALLISRGGPPEGAGPVPRPEATESARAQASGAAADGQVTSVKAATVTVTSRPHGAQVLLRVGRGGAPIPGFSIGEAHELVVLRPGAPAVRVPIPPDAQWDEGRRLTLALERASPSSQETGVRPLEDLGPTRISPDLGKADGRLGSVTVSAPASAIVYKLVGFTPDVELSGLLADRDVELLVYRRGYEHATVTFKASELARNEGTVFRTVELVPLG